MWKEVVKKTIDVEVKISLQPPSEIKNIEARCPNSYQLTKKDQFSRNHQDDKAKCSYNTFLANTSQPQIQNQAQTFREDKQYQKSQKKGHLATRVNTTKVAKKGQDKTKDLSYIKCYICKQKDH